MMNYTPEAFKKIVLQKLAGKMKSRTALAIGVYKNPEDYAAEGKDIYLARLWKIENDNVRPWDDTVCITHSWGELQNAIPEHMVFFQRSKEDLPCVVGTYL